MKKIQIAIFVFVGILAIAVPVFAAGGVVPCDGPDCQACSFVQLGQNIITWFIGISASVIALTFAWGGMKMVMSGGDTGTVSSARSMMTNSVIGLIILLGSWLIVDTVLKSFVDQQKLGVWYKVQCVSVPVSASPIPGSGTPSPTVVGAPSGSVLSQDAAMSRLTTAGVNVTSSSGVVKADCTGVSGCTSLQGIKDATVQDAIDLKNACNCSVTITAGTENNGGHSTAGTMNHGSGYKYDIRLDPKLDSYITTNYKSSGTRSDGAAMYTAPDGTVYAKEGNHWDVLVKS